MALLQTHLQNLASGEPSPPDENDAKHDSDTAFSMEGVCPKISDYAYNIDSAFIKMSIEDAYPAYFDHMACAYATAGDPSSIPEALAGPDAHLWVEALNRETSHHEKNGTLASH